MCAKIRAYILTGAKPVYLNEHPDVADEYETLKLNLWKSMSTTEMPIRMPRRTLFVGGRRKLENNMGTDTAKFQFVDTFPHKQG